MQTQEKENERNNSFLLTTSRRCNENLHQSRLR